MLFSDQDPNRLPDFGFSRRMGLIHGCDFDFVALANQLDCLRDFDRAGIVYSDVVNEWLVRPSRRIANPNQSTVTHVIVIKVPAATPHIATKEMVKTLQRPVMANEITSTLISCGAAVATVILSAGTGATAPLTAGTTGVVAAVIAAGSLATAGQCLNGGWRLYAISTGDEDYVAWLDTDEWYIATITALDVISLAGAGVGLKSTVDTYKLMKKASSTGPITWLKSLTRPERRRITEEIIRVRNPGISNGGIKAAMKAGVYPKRYPSEAIQRSLQRELITAMVNGSAFVGSALSGTIRHPQNIAQSGKYVIGVIQSIATNGN